MKPINKRVIVKRYTDDLFKVVYMKCGVGGRIDELKHWNDVVKKETIPSTMKLRNNIARARTKVYELAFCNQWQYYVTLTIAPWLGDRTDLGAWVLKWRRFIGKYRALGDNLDYLLVPELHNDGVSWHIHGLLAGLPADSLTFNEYGHLDWIAYRIGFGFCNIQPVKNAEAVSKYILKYIGKGFDERKKNEHLYYRSKGLKMAQEEGVGEISRNIEWDYNGDYCSILWANNEWIKNNVIF